MTDSTIMDFEDDGLTVVIHQYGDVTLCVAHSPVEVTLDPGKREALGLALLGLTDRRALAEKIAASASEIIIRELGGAS